MEDDLTRLGWRIWQSNGGRDGGKPGAWYATRLSARRPAPDREPEGWSMTVSGDSEQDVRDAITRQIALDSEAFWLRLRM